MVIIFSDSSTVEDNMSSAIAGEPFKFSSVSLESLKTTVDLLKSSSPGYVLISILSLKELFSFTRSDHVKNMQ